jgi:hypothetical protein
MVAAAFWKAIKGGLEMKLILSLSYYRGGIMSEDYLRTHSFRMVLTPDEAARLKRQADDLGISQANVFRRALRSDVFEDADVRQGRKEGISPQRRTG